MAPIGVGATDVIGRLASSFGGMGPVTPEFSPCMDVSNAGLLLALPALISNGLLRHTDKLFQLPRGFYGLYSIFILIAFMLLARVKSAERLRYCAPGEWGKLLGLDRIPEVRTVREKIRHLSDKGNVKAWSSELCKEWMLEEPKEAGFLYIDGHVRTYYGKKARLPKHYVARQKLCMNATCDYWVNGMNGVPFFLAPTDVDPGLLKVLEHQIVPRLEKDIPNQPSKEQLEADPTCHRFVLVFDREGYSPEFMLRMKNKRIACLTYNKHPKKDWPVEEFSQQTVKLVSGESVEMSLAERGTFLGNKLWVREFRRLMKGGHQTSIISTAYGVDAKKQAMGMFGRWSQENFFKYMRQHFNLDKLASYSVEEIPEETKVVNPAYRALDGEVRKKTMLLARKRALFASITIEGEIEKAKIESYQKEKAILQEEIIIAQTEIETLKKKRKETQKHIKLKELPQDERFQRLSSQSKDFLDTIKMIVYRAETAMVNILKSFMAREDDSRSLVRSLYKTAGDIIPEKENGILRIRLHHMANKAADKLAQELLKILNETETIFPGTNLRIFYEMVSL